MLFRRVNTVSLQQTLGLAHRRGQVPGHSNILGVKIRLGGLMGFNSWCSVLWGYCTIQLMGWSHTLLIPKPTKCFGLTKDTRECFAGCGMSISHLHVEQVPKILLWCEFATLWLELLVLLTAGRLASPLSW